MSVLPQTKEPIESEQSLESMGKPDAWKLARPVWGWGRAVMPGLHHSSDTGFAAIKTAYFTNTPLALLILDADFSVTNFSRNEPLEEAITVDVTVKPTYSTRTAGPWPEAAV